MKTFLKIFLLFVIILFNFCNNPSTVDRQVNPTEDNKETSLTASTKNQVKYDTSKICLELDTLPFLEDQFIYDFINSIKTFTINDYVRYDLSTDKMNSVIESKMHNYDTTKYIDIGRVDFEENDLSFLKKQIYRAKNKYWNLRKFGARESFVKFKAIFESEDKFDWEVFYKYGFKSTVTIGLPLFNKNRNIAIVYISTCEGSLAGLSCIVKYKLENGVWKEVKAFNVIVS